MGTFVLILKMATAVRTCGALARSAVASNGLVRVGCHLNRPAIPVSLLLRKLSTTPISKLRSEKEMSKGWESKGLYPHDKWRDEIAYRMVFFSIGIMLVAILWVYRYAPDNMKRHWAMREAYLVLQERESKNMEKVSRDYIDPDKIELPSDEELGDMRIYV